MELCATLTRDDLSDAIDEITPLRVVIRPRRTISLGRPTNVELVPSAGLRLRGDARFTWDVGGLPVPVTLSCWQVLLVPSFVAREGRHVLAFEPTVEHLDFKGVPMVLGARIADAVREGVLAQKRKLAWDFAKHLSVTWPMPERVTPAREIELGPVGGNITVTSTELRLTLTFALHVRDSRGPRATRTREDFLST